MSRPLYIAPMRLALAAVVLFVAVGPGWAGQIQCTATAESLITIALNSERFAGRELSCISGIFIADLTPCAPAKAFSLSAPTGSASIVGIVSRWQDYAKHDGGVVSFFKSHTTIVFSGGFNDPDSGFHDDWSFSIDRKTKIGLLTRKNKPQATYHCNGPI